MDLIHPTFCHYPALPAPLADELPLYPEEVCPYFKDRRSRYRAFYAKQLPGLLYHELMNAGFRRSGSVFYQPACRNCRDCIPIRVPVKQFQPNKSQRRAWKLNQDLQLTVGQPEFTPEKQRLYASYLEHWHSRPKGEAMETKEFLYRSPVPTLEFCYRDPAGKLVAVGICDVCSESLSSVYFFFDPNEASRSLGTFGAVTEITFAQTRGIPFYYIGFWLEQCREMSYKANFRPYELLDWDGVWRAPEGLI